MPLFGRKPAETTTPVVPAKNATPQRNSTIFGRRQEASTTTHNTTTSSPQRHSVLHRNHEDASIVAARERVQNAEAAEREADRALIQARAAVKEARAHVKMIAKEAAEEARLARIKQEQASTISKKAKGLGRHNHV
ncbi:hypothetical protein LSUE1_G007926 [Lachnellula suecica]|uniref:Uncharacterized protein n=1 Tax=Lachnellula suecica TaxID=602035 RepID=A0A8T9BX78_9HELO|nr:hypothetical protein LSUE1_G007926 [Lachnellula suecica]